MSKNIKSSKTQKTVKVSTLIVAVGFVATFVAGVIAGAFIAGKYNDSVAASAAALSSKIQGK